MTLVPITANITAFVLSGIVGGRRGQKVWRGGTRWRIEAFWYAIVLVVPGLASGAGCAVAAQMGAVPRSGRGFRP